MSVELDSWDIADVAIMTELLNTADPFDVYGVEQVRELIGEDPDLAPDLLVCARADGELVGVAAAVARRFPDRPDSPPAGYVKLFAVAPHARGQGTGTKLLHEVEQRLARAGARTVRFFGDSPAYLRPGVDHRNTALASFLLRRGYRRPSMADVVNMAVDLRATDLATAADEARLAARGIVIRRLEVADSERFIAYVRGRWSWGWQVEACRTLARRPVATHIALLDGLIVGFASHGTGGPDQFGPTGVDADQRGHGIGAVLLKRCLADIRDAGYAQADIQWVGPIGFYGRHVGARIWRSFMHFERELVAGEPEA